MEETMWAKKAEAMERCFFGGGQPTYVHRFDMPPMPDQLVLESKVLGWRMEWSAGLIGTLTVDLAAPSIEAFERDAAVLRARWPDCDVRPT